MATLSKHGDYIKFKMLFHDIAFCEDRTVLRNSGGGWKVQGKLKKEVKDYKEAAEVKQRAIKDICQKNLAYAKFRSLMLQYGLEGRKVIHMALDMLGDDIDGIWSELNENPFSPYRGRNTFTIEDIKELHSAYEAYKQEARENGKSV